MGAEPLVSVVVPVYGRFGAADEAIRSVRTQEAVAADIIAVDDGSDPPYVPGVEPGPDFRCVRLPANAGPGPAREAGRVLARGDYVAYLDSDDRWEPSFARKLTDLLAASPELGMAYCGIPASISKVKGPWRTGDPILPRLLWGRPWHTSSCLWRREAVDRIGPWRNVWRWEDYVYDNRAGCLGIHVGYLDEPLLRIGDDYETGGHISAIAKTPRQTDGFARAVALMVEDIAETDWIRNNPVRIRLTRLVLGAAAQAAETGSAEGARVGLAMLKHLDTMGLADRALLAGASAALDTRGRGLSARLLRRLRRRLPDPPVPAPEDMITGS